METTEDEGDQASFAFFRPILLMAVCMACTKTTHESRNNFNVEDKSDSPVISIAQAPPAIARRKKKKIYLTFDDGPIKARGK